MATTAKKAEAPVKINDGITAVIEPQEEGPKVPMVSVFIPENPLAGDSAVDPYEHVTINNRDGAEQRYYVKRGERVEVPVPVFIQLRNRYPNL